jgi:PAS domain S-box-containing protein
MRERSAPTVTRYGVAVASMFAATVLRLVLNPVLANRFPFATVFFGVLLSAWFGGFGPALLASALGGIFSAWFLLPPQYTLIVQGSENQLGLVLYFAVSIGLAFIGGAMHAARRRAEANAVEAGAQREQFRVTFESIGDAVITTDMRGRLTSMNSVAVELTGWSADGAIGRPLEEVFRIINEQTGAAATNPVDTVLAEGRMVGLANHTVLIARNGSARPIDDSAAPIRNREGAVVGVVLVFRDVTESRRANERLRDSEKELGDFFDNANVGLHFVGPDGIVLRANQAELEMLGYAPDEYVGRHISEFHVDQEVIADILQRLAAGETLHGRPARLRCKDGSIKDVLINSSVRWEHGRFVHTRCFTLDVTARRRAEETQALLAAVVESSEDAIITKTLGGVITSWNAGAERLFGYTAAEAIGRPITMIIPPDRQGEESAILQGLSAGQRTEHFETVRIAKDGRRVDLSLTVSPVRDPSGRFIGASKVARDVTARKRTEQALHEGEERFRSFASNAPAAIFIKDLEGRYTLANPLACEALGRPDAVVGLTDHDLLPQPVADELRRRDAAVIASGRPIESEEVISRPGYERRFLSVKFPLFGAAGPIAVCGVAIDITDRKGAEEALRVADKRKDAFLATLAHELRNPLAPIRNSLEIMKRVGGDARLLHEAQGVIDRQMTHFERLVDDLVDVARISHDQLELRRERVDLSSVVQQAVETCRPLAEASRLDLTVTLAAQPIRLDADPVRLAQVFSNLLNNACKYTAAGGRISIDARREGADAVVSIRDTGVGIPADMLSGVFDMFTQLGQLPERAQSGLGIGLTLVRRLVEMHGGSVEAHSEGRGSGSEFVVRVPLTTGRTESPPVPAPAVEAPPFRRRVLIVDDNVDAAESLSTLLQIDGHETRIAHDGAAAVGAAESFRPDVVLLDIGLPKLSGHDVARQIRAQTWGKEMVLVALTGWGQDEDRHRSWQTGFDHHMVKPVDMATLMRVLASPRGDASGAPGTVSRSRNSG